ncbi:SHOCT domain-containing protein [Sinomonas sp. R1AF57]|uniref:SHOCT domain-containing protein n=1 Tax=Sinomonas sp. R1AF57 TaxID=2020377 RepID=UPI000B61362C|nr:SHOCT domain-containing protein [Sinomonas sp. R1AF57]ASN51309.1 hypothetical protein CGQ25_03820 [Sinomonas sp. R1AF57]
MMYWNGNMGVWGWIFMILSFLLFWGAIITGIVFLARSVRHGGQGSGAWGQPGWGGGAMPVGMPPGQYPGPGPEQVLADRFARGEIDEAEYRARLDVLKQQHRGGA